MFLLLKGWQFVITVKEATFPYWQMAVLQKLADYIYKAVPQSTGMGILQPLFQLFRTFGGAACVFGERLFLGLSRRAYYFFKFCRERIEPQILSH